MLLAPRFCALPFSLPVPLSLRFILKLLLDSGRYRPGAKPFQLVVEVDLKDGAKPVEVEVGAPAKH
jgi:hypothetical protein